MWTWSLNWDEITPRILVGTCPMTTVDLDRIGAEAGVSAVLSVQHDHCLAYWDIDYAEMRTHGEKLGLRMARSRCGISTSPTSGAMWRRRSRRWRMRNRRGIAPWLLFPTIFRHETLRFTRLAAGYLRHTTASFGTWREGL
jgi:hypothetical protein